MKTKFFFTIIIILSSILTIVVFAIWPNISRIKKLNHAIYEQRVRLEKLYVQGQLLRTTREELERVTPQLEILNNLFILKDGELEFITALEKIASQNKLEQKIELNLSQEKELEANYKAIPIRLVLKGDFLNTLKYLAEIERMDFYLNLGSLHLESLIKISSRDQISPKKILSSSEEQIQTLISAEGYWQKEKIKN